MPDGPRRIYWDSCVVLHYIEGTPKWMPVLDSLLDDASRSNELVINTSSGSIVEVAFAKAEKDGGVLDPTIEAGIDAFWDDRTAIRLVEFNEVIGRSARGLLRRAVQDGRHLKPMDAIHLATAQNRRVDDFHTLDERPKKSWSVLGFPVRDPHTPRPKLFTP
jgi:predicted nucleic acid-binding protein